jgi:hypothetical protein
LAWRTSSGFSPTLSALALAGSNAAVLTSGTQLGNQLGFFISSERACNLPHHQPRRIAAVGEIVTGCRQNANAALDERQDAQLLRHQLAGEPGCVLNEDCANAVALDAIKQCRREGSVQSRRGFGRLFSTSEHSAGIS